MCSGLVSPCVRRELNSPSVTNPRDRVALTVNNKVQEETIPFTPGEAPPQGPTPHPFTYHFGRKGTPFICLLLKKRYPFHIPILGSLVLVFM